MCPRNPQGRRARHLVLTWGPAPPGTGWTGVRAPGLTVLVLLLCRVDSTSLRGGTARDMQGRDSDRRHPQMGRQSKIGSVVRGRGGRLGWDPEVTDPPMPPGVAQGLALLLPLCAVGPGEWKLTEMAQKRDCGQRQEGTAAAGTEVATGQGSHGEHCVSPARVTLH